jgi:hypothetical protein
MRVESVSRRSPSPETRARLSEAKRRWWAERTPEERRRQNGLLGKKLTAAERQKIRDGIAAAKHRRSPVGRMQAGGRLGASEHRRRWAEDAVYRNNFSAALSAAMTPERRADNGERMRQTQKIRFECGDCGRITNGGGLAKHQRATGHTTKRRIDHEDTR